MSNEQKSRQLIDLAAKIQNLCYRGKVEAEDIRAFFIAELARLKFEWGQR